MCKKIDVYYQVRDNEKILGETVFTMSVDEEIANKLIETEESGIATGFIKDILTKISILQGLSFIKILLIEYSK